MRIKVIVPITTKEFEKETRQEAEKFVSKGTKVDVECIKYGTASIESAYDENLCAPGIIKLAEETEKKGFDGIFITCMGDPAVDACREKLNIPVVGPARVSMLYASDLALKFSIVTVLENVITMFEDNAYKLRIGDKLASVRSVDIPVLGLHSKEKLITKLADESIKAIDIDGAHAIVLGCTGMMGVHEELSTRLVEKGYDIPVIYPVPVAISYLESLITLGLKQSRKTYMKPPEGKERNIWDRLT